MSVVLVPFRTQQIPISFQSAALQMCPLTKLKQYERTIEVKLNVLALVDRTENTVVVYF